PAHGTRRARTPRRAWRGRGPRCRERAGCREPAEFCTLQMCVSPVAMEFHGGKRAAGWLTVRRRTRTPQVSAVPGEESARGPALLLPLPEADLVPQLVHVRRVARVRAVRGELV